MASSTSYAVLAKARAKYGKRLTEKDYKNLLNCKSVAEVMSYLKSYTHYGTALKEVNEQDVHRGQLEHLLRQQLFYDFDSLCHYETSVGAIFSKFVIRRMECQLLMNFITMLNSKTPEDFLFTIPAYFEKHSNLNFTQLSKANTYEEFLSMIEKSSYYPILCRFKPEKNGLLPIAAMENSLYTFILSDLYEGIEKNSPKQEKEELKSYFDTLLDYENFIRIIRLKKYYNMTPEEIKKNLLPFGSLKTYQLDRICSAENSKEAFAVMSSLRQGMYIKKTSYFYTGSLVAKVRYRKSINNIYFSNSPAAVMISYMFATETELANIICLIEGTRYNVDSKKIESLLIYEKTV